MDDSKNIQIRLSRKEYDELEKKVNAYRHTDPVTIVRWMIQCWIEGTLNWIPPHGEE